MSSKYTFTVPIRYYKANDPNYFEVDNLPLRQMEENILYLKTAIEGTDIVDSNSTAEFSLSQIKDLKITPAGGMSVKVNPGKFIARINSINKAAAYLSKLNFSIPVDNIGTNVGLSESLGEAFYQALLATFSAAAGPPYYGFNGLETMNTFFAHKYRINLGIVTATGTGIPEYTLDANTDPNGSEIGYPVLTHGGFKDVIASVFSSNNPKYMLEVHRNFVQAWGGVFRTAVVSFDETQTLEIPIIDSDELFIETENGTRTTIPVTQRIDLIFAYAVPVDALSGSQIIDYSQTAKAPGVSVESVPRTLYRPEIGIVRGAGVGIKQTDNPNSYNPLYLGGTTTHLGSNGKPKIMVHPLDSYAATPIMGMLDYNGTTRIQGSFPSPDDLLNIAPAIVDGVLANYNSINNPNIGQTAIPLAYVVVFNTTVAIAKSNIIDIRPFLRTTELTYNERAGIAAASPPLSFANTAVGTLQFREVIDSLRTELLAAVTTATPATTFLDTPVLLYYAHHFYPFGAGGWNSTVYPQGLFGTQNPEITFRTIQESNIYYDIDVAAYVPDNATSVILNIGGYNTGDDAENYVILLWKGMAGVTTDSLTSYTLNPISLNIPNGTNIRDWQVTVPISNDSTLGERKFSFAIPAAWWIPRDGATTASSVASLASERKPATGYRLPHLNSFRMVLHGYTT